MGQGFYAGAMTADRVAPRLATSGDAEEVGRLLHDFNSEFETPSPGVDILADRLRDLLAGDRTLAVLSGRPPVGVALVTLRPNVWYPGEVALLDELYVVPTHRNNGIGSAIIAHLEQVLRTRRVSVIEISVDEGDVDAQRFYERHGYSAVGPDTNERAISYVLELDSSS